MRAGVNALFVHAQRDELRDVPYQRYAVLPVALFSPGSQERLRSEAYYRYRDEFPAKGVTVVVVAVVRVLGVRADYTGSDVQDQSEGNEYAGDNAKRHAPVMQSISALRWRK